MQTCILTVFSMEFILWLLLWFTIFIRFKIFVHTANAVIALWCCCCCYFFTVRFSILQTNWILRFFIHLVVWSVPWFPYRRTWRRCQGMKAKHTGHNIFNKYYLLWRPKYKIVGMWCDRQNKHKTYFMRCDSIWMKPHINTDTHIQCVCKFVINK